MTKFDLPRRNVLSVALAGAVWLCLPRNAPALEPDAAIAHVNATIDDVVALIGTKRSRSDTAKALRRIFEERTALAQIARFCAGRHWQNMSEPQKRQYTEAFSDYLAHVYAGFFGEYEGDVAELRSAIDIVKTIDVGAKGVLVHSKITPERDAPVSLDWLISDRSGRVAISDLVIEGISLAVTNRETVTGMFEARDGDVVRLIADMEREASQ